MRRFFIFFVLVLLPVSQLFSGIRISGTFDSFVSVNMNISNSEFSNASGIPFLEKAMLIGDLSMTYDLVKEVQGNIRAFIGPFFSNNPRFYIDSAYANLYKGPLKFEFYYRERVIENEDPLGIGIGDLYNTGTIFLTFGGAGTGNLFREFEPLGFYDEDIAMPGTDPNMEKTAKYGRDSAGVVMSLNTSFLNIYSYYTLIPVSLYASDRNPTGYLGGSANIPIGLSIFDLSFSLQPGLVWLFDLSPVASKTDSRDRLYGLFFTAKSEDYATALFLEYLINSPDYPILSWLNSNTTNYGQRYDYSEVNDLYIGLKTEIIEGTKLELVGNIGNIFSVTNNIGEITKVSIGSILGVEGRLYSSYDITSIEDSYFGVGIEGGMSMVDHQDTGETENELFARASAEIGIWDLVILRPAGLFESQSIYSNTTLSGNRTKMEIIAEGELRPLKLFVEENKLGIGGGIRYVSYNYQDITVNGVQVVGTRNYTFMNPYGYLIYRISEESFIRLSYNLLPSRDIYSMDYGIGMENYVKENYNAIYDKILGESAYANMMLIAVEARITF